MIILLVKKLTYISYPVDCRTTELFFGRSATDLINNSKVYAAKNRLRMRFFFIVSSFPWSADANNVKAFLLPRRKLKLLKEILATSGVEYISFQFLIGNSMWKAKCCQKTLLRRKYESRRRGTRVLLVVGRRHVPPTWDLERGIFVCRNTVDDQSSEHYFW